MGVIMAAQICEFCEHNKEGCYCSPNSVCDKYEPIIIKREGWIPCSEDLPECHLTRDVFNRPQGYMSDSVLVTVKSDECDGVHYFVGTDYMSGKTKEEAYWMMSCGYSGSAVYNQEIIAWMYKPDPYKE